MIRYTINLRGENGRPSQYWPSGALSRDDAALEAIGMLKARDWAESVDVFEDVTLKDGRWIPSERVRYFHREQFICAFCGAEMRTGDKVGECSHPEGQGGAAASL